MKNFNDTIGNRTRDLPGCSAVPLTLRIQENEWQSKCCAFMLQPNNNAIQFNSSSTGLYYNNNNNYYYYCCDYYNYSFIGVAVKSKVKARVQRTSLGAPYPFFRKYKKNLHMLFEAMSHLADRSDLSFLLTAQ
jgi:hypothetical protein